MKYQEDQRDLALLRAGDARVFKRIYINFKKRLISYLKKKYENYVYYWEDLISETITIVLENEKEVDLKCELMTYLIKIALNQLQKKIDKDKYLEFTDRRVEERANVESMYEEAEKNERRIIVNEALQKLTEKCRKIIKAFCRTVNCTDAASLLKYKSGKVYSVKKSECMRDLEEILKEDPRYLELMSLKEE